METDAGKERSGNDGAYNGIFGPDVANHFSWVDEVVERHEVEPRVEFLEEVVSATARKIIANNAIQQPAAISALLTRDRYQRLGSRPR